MYRYTYVKFLNYIAHAAPAELESISLSICYTGGFMLYVKSGTNATENITVIYYGTIFLRIIEKRKNKKKNGQTTQHLSRKPAATIA